LHAIFVLFAIDGQFAGLLSRNEKVLFGMKQYRSRFERFGVLQSKKSQRRVLAHPGLVAEDLKPVLHVFLVFQELSTGSAVDARRSSM
jgi:hypothetical protein